ncbi:hypothetical protein BD626DRAFT_497416 [Schizophyllum amplum]|uniref:Uncharacterized protein n=1 Tax=Schizophyllum amplum TaxID=97359 RepID=A0A550CE33_9AGAR|nr:hypothetical protein BD626DRAFT_497416 [Auriculariopsis ampla]
MRTHRLPCTSPVSITKKAKLLTLRYIVKCAVNARLSRSAPECPRQRIGDGVGLLHVVSEREAAEMLQQTNPGKGHLVLGELPWPGPRQRRGRQPQSLQLHFWETSTNDTLVSRASEYRRQTQAAVSHRSLACGALSIRSSVFLTPAIWERDTCICTSSRQWWRAIKEA